MIPGGGAFSHVMKTSPRFVKKIEAVIKPFMLEEVKTAMSTPRDVFAFPAEDYLSS